MSRIVNENPFESDRVVHETAKGTRLNVRALLLIALVGLGAFLMYVSTKRDAANARVMECAQARQTATGGELRTHFDACQAKMEKEAAK